jgi:NADPH2:quinone reductase
VVKSVGDGVTQVRPGDHVIAVIRWGAFAEEVIVPADRAWPIPSSIDFAPAAAFPLAYSTSYHALKDRGQLKAGETLLVTGAAGGVGLAAVQLGKILGARVIACASSDEKLATCRAHGADDTINYSSEDFREAIRRLTDGRGLDVVADPVGGPLAEPAIRSMAWGGRYCILGFTSGTIPKVALNLALLKGCSLVGVVADTFTYREPEAGRRNYAELIEMISSGRLKPAVSKVMPLADAVAALNEVRERRVVGKIVLVP